MGLSCCDTTKRSGHYSGGKGMQKVVAPHFLPPFTPRVAVTRPRPFFLPLVSSHSHTSSPCTTQTLIRAHPHSRRTAIRSRRGATSGHRLATPCLRASPASPPASRPLPKQLLRHTPMTPLIPIPTQLLDSFQTPLGDYALSLTSGGTKYESTRPVAEQRHGVADQRFEVADQRLGVADQRPRVTDQRHKVADQRLKVADRRSWV